MNRIRLPSRLKILPQPERLAELIRHPPETPLSLPGDAMLHRTLLALAGAATVIAALFLVEVPISVRGQAEIIDATALTSISPLNSATVRLAISVREDAASDLVGREMMLEPTWGGRTNGFAGRIQSIERGFDTDRLLSNVPSLHVANVVLSVPSERLERGAQFQYTVILKKQSTFRWLTQPFSEGATSE